MKLTIEQFNRKKYFFMHGKIKCFLQARELTIEESTGLEPFGFVGDIIDKLGKEIGTFGIYYDGFLGNIFATIEGTTNYLQTPKSSLPEPQNIR